MAVSKKRCASVLSCLLLAGSTAPLAGDEPVAAGDRPAPFSWPEGRRAALSLTFDDARASQVDAGLAILAEHGVKATFYVLPAGLAARREGWKEAAAAGHEIGSHTLTHPCTGSYAFSRDNALEEYTLERIDRELIGASDAIRKALGVTVSSFAYPCGQTYVGRGLDVRSYVPLVARAFRTGRKYLDEDSNDPTVLDLAQLLAVGSDGLSFEEVLPLVEKAAADGRWLILAGHEIGTAGHQTTRLDTLDALCRYARDPANGIWIDTVDAVARHILRQRRALVSIPPGQE